MLTARLLIAVLDGDAFLGKALQRLLRSAGFNAETYSSGSEFLRSLSSHAPDCLVLDLHMPELNGFDVQVELQRMGASIPVIVITGHDTPESRARALRNGAKAYINKPVDDKLLLSTISTAIGRPLAPGESGKTGPPGA